MTSVKLSKRLNTISRLVPDGSVVFDVGSDHALLPCHLVESGKCAKAYAGDNKREPLKRAEANIKKYHLEGRVIPVLSDGLDEAPEDADTVVISGMGFFTMRDILEKCDTSRYERFILEANKDVNLLRNYINEKKYSIIDEYALEED